MRSICQVVEQTLQRGYLTVEAETQIQQWICDRCTLEDIDALTQLQHAVTLGQVKRLSQASLDTHSARDLQ